MGEISPFYTFWGMSVQFVDPSFLSFWSVIPSHLEGPAKVDQTEPAETEMAQCSFGIGQEAGNKERTLPKDKVRSIQNIL